MFEELKLDIFGRFLIILQDKTSNVSISFERKLVMNRIFSCTSIHLHIDFPLPPKIKQV